MSRALTDALGGEAASLAGAVVYLDEAAADTIAISYGAEEMLALSPAALLPLPSPYAGSGATAVVVPSGRRSGRLVVLVGAPLELHAACIESILREGGNGDVDGLPGQRWQQCLVLSALPGDVHDGATPLGGFAARFRAVLDPDGRLHDSAVQVRQLPALGCAAILPPPLPAGGADTRLDASTYTLAGFEDTHGLRLPASCTQSDYEIGCAAASIDALLIMLRLSLPADRDTAGVFVACAASDPQGSGVGSSTGADADTVSVASAAGSVVSSARLVRRVGQRHVGPHRRRRHEQQQECDLQEDLQEI